MNLDENTFLLVLSVQSSWFLKLQLIPPMFHKDFPVQYLGSGNCNKAKLHFKALPIPAVIMIKTNEAHKFHSVAHVVFNEISRGFLGMACYMQW